MFMLLLVVTFFGAIAAETAKFIPCGGSPPCSIAEVRIHPCTHPTMCKLRKGQTYSISYDYTPNFSAEKVRAGFFWSKETGDVAFPDMHDSEACGFTACPVVADKQQTFDYSLRLSKKLPNGQFQFKLKLWDEANTSNNCCFKTKIELKRK